MGNRQGSAHDLRELRLREPGSGTLLTASLRASFRGTSMQSSACSSSGGGTWASRLAASCLGNTPAASAQGLEHAFVPALSCVNLLACSYSAFGASGEHQRAPTRAARGSGCRAVSSLSLSSKASPATDAAAISASCLAAAVCSATCTKQSPVLRLPYLEGAMPADLRMAKAAVTITESS